MTSTITSAIRDKHLLELQYKGYCRVVEPHTFGRDKRTQEDRLSGWQVAGKPLDPPDWRYYDASEMTSVHALQQTFAGARDGYARNDRRMSVIYAEL